ncbi:GyrI-like domain-containing protein [Actinomadura sp. 3N407]|uniref:GyrI-like domain-containing protein n=1 Tax=Actinomadura sp. 3N407 TaxID=3457423 RepID=UPI003FCC2F00
MTTQLPFEPSFEERPAVPYAAIKRDDITAANFARIADRIPVILGWLGGRGIAAAGAPFLKYDVIRPDGTFQVVAGVPLASPVEDDGEIFAATLPAGRYVAFTHAGHPDRLIEITTSVLDWGTGQGFKWDMTESGGAQHWACRLEIFKTHPLEVPDPNDWVTDVAVKLADG